MNFSHEMDVSDTDSLQYVDGDESPSQSEYVWKKKKAILTTKTEKKINPDAVAEAKRGEASPCSIRHHRRDGNQIEDDILVGEREQEDAEVSDFCTSLSPTAPLATRKDVVGSSLEKDLTSDSAEEDSLDITKYCHLDSEQGVRGDSDNFEENEEGKDNEEDSSSITALDSENGVEKNSGNCEENGEEEENAEDSSEEDSSNITKYCQLKSGQSVKKNIDNRKENGEGTSKVLDPGSTSTKFENVTYDITLEEDILVCVVIKGGRTDNDSDSLEQSVEWKNGRNMSFSDDECCTSFIIADDRTLSTTNDGGSKSSDENGEESGEKSDKSVEQNTPTSEEEENESSNKSGGVGTSDEQQSEEFLPNVSTVFPELMDKEDIIRNLLNEYKISTGRTSENKFMEDPENLKITLALQFDQSENTYESSCSNEENDTVDYFISVDNLCESDGFQKLTVKSLSSSIEDVTDTKCNVPHCLSLVDSSFSFLGQEESTPDSSDECEEETDKDVGVQTMITLLENIEVVENEEDERICNKEEEGVEVIQDKRNDQFERVDETKRIRVQKHPGTSESTSMKTNKVRGKSRKTSHQPSHRTKTDSKDIESNAPKVFQENDSTKDLKLHTKVFIKGSNSHNTEVVSSCSNYESNTGTIGSENVVKNENEVVLKGEVVDEIGKDLSNLSKMEDESENVVSSLREKYKEVLKMELGKLGNKSGDDLNNLSKDDDFGFENAISLTNDANEFISSKEDGNEDESSQLETYSLSESSSADEYYYDPEEEIPSYSNSNSQAMEIRSVVGSEAFLGMVEECDWGDFQNKAVEVLSMFRRRLIPGITSANDWIGYCESRYEEDPDDDRLGVIDEETEEDDGNDDESDGGEEEEEEEDTLERSSSDEGEEERDKVEEDVVSNGNSPSLNSENTHQELDNIREVNDRYKPLNKQGGEGNEDEEGHKEFDKVEEDELSNKTSPSLNSEITNRNLDNIREVNDRYKPLNKEDEEIETSPTISSSSEAMLKNLDEFQQVNSHYKVLLKDFKAEDDVPKILTDGFETVDISNRLKIELNDNELKKLTDRFESVDPNLDELEAASKVDQDVILNSDETTLSSLNSELTHRNLDDVREVNDRYKILLETPVCDENSGTTLMKVGARETQELNGEREEIEGCDNGNEEMNLKDNINDIVSKSIVLNKELSSKIAFNLIKVDNRIKCDSSSKNNRNNCDLNLNSANLLKNAESDDTNLTNLHDLLKKTEPNIDEQTNKSSTSQICKSSNNNLDLLNTCNDNSRMKKQFDNLYNTDNVFDKASSSLFHPNLDLLEGCDSITSYQSKQGHFNCVSKSCDNFDLLKPNTSLLQGLDEKLKSRVEQQWEDLNESNGELVAQSLTNDVKTDKLMEDNFEDGRERSLKSTDKFTTNILNEELKSIVEKQLDDLENDSVLEMTSSTKVLQESSVGDQVKTTKLRNNVLEVAINKKSSKNVENEHSSVSQVSCGETSSKKVNDKHNSKKNASKKKVVASTDKLLSTSSKNEENKEKKLDKGHVDKYEVKKKENKEDLNRKSGKSGRVVKDKREARRKADEDKGDSKTKRSSNEDRLEKIVEEACGRKRVDEGDVKNCDEKTSGNGAIKNRNVNKEFTSKRADKTDGSDRKNSENEDKIDKSRSRGVDKSGTKRSLDGEDVIKCSDNDTRIENDILNVDGSDMEKIQTREDRTCTREIDENNTNKSHPKMDKLGVETDKFCEKGIDESGTNKDITKGDNLKVSTDKSCAKGGDENGTNKSHAKKAEVEIETNEYCEKEINESYSKRSQTDGHEIAAYKLCGVVGTDRKSYIEGGEIECSQAVPTPVPIQQSGTRDREIPNALSKYTPGTEGEPERMHLQEGGAGVAGVSRPWQGEEVEAVRAGVGGQLTPATDSLVSTCWLEPAQCDRAEMILSRELDGELLGSHPRVVRTCSSTAEVGEDSLRRPRRHGSGDRTRKHSVGETNCYSEVLSEVRYQVIDEKITGSRDQVHKHSVDDNFSEVGPNIREHSVDGTNSNIEVRDKVRPGFEDDVHKHSVDCFSEVLPSIRGHSINKLTSCSQDEFIVVTDIQHHSVDKLDTQDDKICDSFIKNLTKSSEDDKIDDRFVEKLTTNVKDLEVRVCTLENLTTSSQGDRNPDCLLENCTTCPQDSEARDPFIKISKTNSQDVEIGFVESFTTNYHDDFSPEIRHSSVNSTSIAHNDTTSETNVTKTLNPSTHNQNPDLDQLLTKECTKNLQNIHSVDYKPEHTFSGNINENNNRKDFSGCLDRSNNNNKDTSSKDSVNHNKCNKTVESSCVGDINNYSSIGLRSDKDSDNNNQNTIVGCEQESNSKQNFSKLNLQTASETPCDTVYNINKEVVLNFEETYSTELKYLNVLKKLNSEVNNSRCRFDKNVDKLFNSEYESCTSFTTSDDSSVDKIVNKDRVEGRKRESRQVVDEIVNKNSVEERKTDNKRVGEVNGNVAGTKFCDSAKKSGGDNNEFGKFSSIKSRNPEFSVNENSVERSEKREQLVREVNGNILGTKYSDPAKKGGDNFGLKGNTVEFSDRKVEEFDEYGGSSDTTDKVSSLGLSLIDNLFDKRLSVGLFQFNSKNLDNSLPGDNGNVGGNIERGRVSDNENGEEILEEVKDKNSPENDDQNGRKISVGEEEVIKMRQKKKTEVEVTEDPPMDNSGDCCNGYSHRTALKSALKRSTKKSSKKKHRVQFDESLNKFFDADYVILIREEPEDGDGMCECGEDFCYDCTEDEDGAAEEVQSPRFDLCAAFEPPMEFVDQVTLSPPDGYKDISQGYCPHHMFQRRSPRPDPREEWEEAGGRPTPAQRPERIETKNEEIQVEPPAGGSRPEHYSDKFSTQTEDSQLQAPPPPKSISHQQQQKLQQQQQQRYIVETITMTTVTERRIVREADNQIQTKTEAASDNNKSLSGILKGGKLWKSLDSDDGTQQTRPAEQPQQNQQSWEESADGRRGVHFCDGQTNTEDLASTPTELTLTFKLGNVANNSSRPNSAVRQLFPGPRFISPPPLLNRSPETEDAGKTDSKYLLTTESLRLFDESKKPKLDQFINQGAKNRDGSSQTMATSPQQEAQGNFGGASDDEDTLQNNLIKRTIERNTLRRSLLRYPHDSARLKRNQNKIKNENSLVERIKQLTLDVEEDVSNSGDERLADENSNSTPFPPRSSPPGEESRPTPSRPDKIASSGGVSSTYRKLTDLFTRRGGEKGEAQHPNSVILQTPASIEHQYPYYQPVYQHTQQTTSPPDLGNGLNTQSLKSTLIARNSVTTEARKQFLSTLAPLTACVSGSGEDSPVNKDAPGERGSVASTSTSTAAETEYSLDDIDEALLDDQGKIAPRPDVVAGTPAGDSQDELALFVQQDAGRIERLRKRYNSTPPVATSEDDEQDDYGFNRRPSVRGIKPRFGSTTEIIQQMQTQLQPPPPGSHVSWPYYSPDVDPRASNLQMNAQARITAGPLIKDENNFAYIPNESPVPDFPSNSPIDNGTHYQHVLYSSTGNLHQPLRIGGGGSMHHMHSDSPPPGMIVPLQEVPGPIYAARRGLPGAGSLVQMQVPVPVRLPHYTTEDAVHYRPATSIIRVGQGQQQTIRVPYPSGTPVQVHLLATRRGTENMQRPPHLVVARGTQTSSFSTTYYQLPPPPPRGTYPLSVRGPLVYSATHEKPPHLTAYPLTRSASPPVIPSLTSSPTRMKPHVTERGVPEGAASSSPGFPQDSVYSVQVSTSTNIPSPQDDPVMSRPPINPNTGQPPNNPVFYAMNV